MLLSLFERIANNFFFHKSTMTLVMMIVVNNARRPQWGKEKVGKPGNCPLAFESFGLLAARTSLGGCHRL
jgi:hypothetical protein